MGGKGKLKSLNKMKIFVLCMLMAGTWGCKTMQKVQRVNDKQESVSLLIEKVQQAAPQFQSIEFKRMNIGINLNNNSRYNSGANCKIIKDSVIHISIQPFFGIEMFVVRLTPEKITVIDKTKSIYYESDYLFFNQQFGLNINFDVFQSLFTNKLFVIGEYEIRPEQFKQIIDKNNQIGLQYENKQLSENIILKDNFRIIDVDIIAKKGMQTFKTNYADFNVSGSIIFPNTINFSLIDDDRFYDFNLSISRLAVDEAINIPVINTNQYRVGSIMSLLK